MSFIINVYRRSKRFGFSLTDSDECNASVSVCDVNANCKNTLGSYRCSCRAGFSGNGRSCKGGKKFDQKPTLIIKQCRCKVLFRWAFFNYYFIRSEIASREQFILHLNAKVRYKCDEIFALLSFDSIFFNSILLQRVYFARQRWVGASIINPRHLTLYFPSVDPILKSVY